MSAPYLDTALAWYDAGACVIRADRAKKPYGHWSNYQTQRPTREQVREWFDDPSTLGVGLICGAISDNLEMVEIEGRAADHESLAALGDQAQHLGLAPLLARLLSGYMERTPSGGIHFLYRIADHPVPGNTKLAKTLNGEVTHETRGEGGFVVIAPTAGKIHPTGQPWTTDRTPADLLTLTWAERNDLHTLFRTLDESPPPTLNGAELHAPSGGRPGDDFNARTTWEQILEPHGWTKVFTARDGITHWRRPEKTEGTSATTGYAGNNILYVFTSSSLFEQEKSYSPFAAYAVLNHHGDYTAASRALSRLGYGTTSTLTAFDPQTGVEAPADPLPLDASPIAILNRRINEEIINGRARREAKRHLDAEDAAATYTAPTYVRDLRQELAQPDPDPEWAIEDLLPLGGNALLTAPYKSGKTTMINHLVKSIADKTDFMGYFPINPDAGRIVVFNYEVDGRQYRRWLRDVAIDHLERVTVVHLRGQRLPIITKPVEDLVVSTLQDLEADTWIIDPFARAFTGCGDENSNSDVGVYLDTLDIIKTRAGVQNLILAAHTGRAVEHGIDRARGATRLDDWADVRWTLHKAEDGARFFSADGRDVAQAEQLVAFEEATRSLKFGGWDRTGHKRIGAEVAVLEWIKTNQGCTQADIIKGTGLSDKTVKTAASNLLRQHKITQHKDGVSLKHYPTGSSITAFEGRAS